MPDIPNQAIYSIEDGIIRIHGPTYVDVGLRYEYSDQIIQLIPGETRIIKEGTQLIYWRLNK